MNNPVVFGGAAGVLLVLVALVLWRRRSSEATASKRAHNEAQQRDAPVEMGETYEVGITEFTDHHSGERVAVGKVEGFVLFTEDVPERLEEGDVIHATVTSFNREQTSADAIFEGTA